MTFKSLYLPIGLCLALLLAVLQPQWGLWLKSQNATPAFVFGIFLINGHQARWSKGDFSPRLLKAFVCLAFTSLVLSPALGYGLARVLGLAAGVQLGLVVMMAMPTTLSSAIVITQVAKGQVVWATLFTMGLSFLSIFSIPPILELALDGVGSLSLDAKATFYKLLQLVLLPFVLGIGLRQIVALAKYKTPISYFPSTLVILCVLASASGHSGLDLQGATWLAMVGCSLVLHLGLYGLHLQLGRWLQLAKAERIAFCFVGSQKTLPLAIGVLSTLKTDITTALIFCICFHFLQLLVDSLLAGRLANHR